MSPLILKIFTGLTSVVEAVVTGRQQGAAKKEIAVEAGHVVLQQLAKNGVIPAVPPKEELSQVSDAAVAFQNANGWAKITAGANVVSEVDDIIKLIRAAGEVAASIKSKA